MFPGMGGLDPSKLSPAVIAEISDLMRTLKPDQIMKMQSLMHNAMAGFKVEDEMAKFEETLPPGFREKMARILYMANGIEVPAKAPAEVPLEMPKSDDEARLVILRAVAGGLMQPEEALQVLFGSSTSSA